jgi:hypothetical protein
VKPFVSCSQCTASLSHVSADPRKASGSKSAVYVAKLVTSAVYHVIRPKLPGKETNATGSPLIPHPVV